ncbi:hypothetical protein MAPG_05842 [Magnaporthiopsis poae ATCC 64411]|uniref:Uncharacterized protein n=1 Tax=Magnaporthiopsis poae (strain ATCC 64411 / 73-15) TaxID=644358 RepID=A0A0C4E0G9_MAGP6|nr:hypothetical protein MAPG_05842 [Magnaporthiopsis poae ATCC 64411]
MTECACVCPRAKGRRRGREGRAGGDNDRGGGGRPCRRQTSWRGCRDCPFESHEADPDGVPLVGPVLEKKGEKKRGRGERKRKEKTRCFPSKAVQGACLAGSEAFPTLRLHRPPLGINTWWGRKMKGRYWDLED